MKDNEILNELGKIVNGREEYKNLFTDCGKFRDGTFHEGSFYGFLILLQERFGVEFSTEDIKNISDLEALAELILERCNQNP